MLITMAMMVVMLTHVISPSQCRRTQLAGRSISIFATVTCVLRYFYRHARALHHRPVGLLGLPVLTLHPRRTVPPSYFLWSSLGWDRGVNGHALRRASLAIAGRFGQTLCYKTAHNGGHSSILLGTECRGAIKHSPITLVTECLGAIKPSSTLVTECRGGIKHSSIALVTECRGAIKPCSITLVTECRGAIKHSSIMLVMGVPGCD